MTASVKIEPRASAIHALLAEISPDEAVAFRDELRAGLLGAAETLDLEETDRIIDRWWGRAALRANPLSHGEVAEVDELLQDETREVGQTRQAG